MKLCKLGWFVPFAALVLVAGWSVQAQAGTGTGEAFGVSAQVGGITIAKTPHVVLPPGGSRDPIDDGLLNLGVTVLPLRRNGYWCLGLCPLV